MKMKHLGLRVLAAVMSVFMAFSLLPVMGIGGSAKADDEQQEKTFECLGASIIKAPAEPANKDTHWTGSYVWYGKYDGDPVRYRVLAPKTTEYHTTAMLLDCDTILYEAQFDEDGEPNHGAQYPNRWRYSDINSGLNGSAFLTKENGFTEPERSAIANSWVYGHTLNTGDAWDAYVVNYVGLTDNRVFLLDYEDVMNPEFGYMLDSGREGKDLCYDVINRVKNNTDGKPGSWWLRSAVNDSSDSNIYVKCGYVSSGNAYGGHFDIETVGTDCGVSPAFNVKLTDIIFTSVVTGTAGNDNAEYKLTLVDDEMKVGTQSGKKPSISGNTVSVPYTVTGEDAGNTTQLSVLILDKPYTAGNANNAAKLYYGKLNTGNAEGIRTTGTGTFTLPLEFSLNDWDRDYCVYLLAEDVNGAHESDYASTPFRLETPLNKTIAGFGTSAIKAPKAPDNKDDPWTGSYVWYGQFEGNPVKYRVLSPKTTAYGGTTMFLESDSLLYKACFDQNGIPNGDAQEPNEWEFSDLKATINGSGFLTKDGVFTALEKTAIAESRIDGHKLNTGNFSDAWYVNYVALKGEKIFILDYEDLLNPTFGYSSDPGAFLPENAQNCFSEWDGHSVRNRVKQYDGEDFWWRFRSAYVNYTQIAGCVGPQGIVYGDDGDVGSLIGVSPAFNINLSSVIFSSVTFGTIGEDNAEYKLTLADSNMTVGIQSGKTLTASGNTITVPYEITGADAANATQLSVMILNTPYTEDNSNDANIIYYGKLNTGTEELATTGTGTFPLMPGFSLDDWNSIYYVYLLAEDVNGIYETDYASTPLMIEIPKNKTIDGLGTSAIKAPKAPDGKDDPWTGSYVWYGQYDGEPVKYRVLAPKTTAYGGMTMFLESDLILFESEFDDDMTPNEGAQRDNEWEFSDLKATLNGSEFLTKDDVFTDLEKAAIAESRIDSHELDTGNFSDIWYGNYVGLKGERVFILDYEDLLNPAYGYSSDPGADFRENAQYYYEYDGHIVRNRIKQYDGEDSWWRFRNAFAYDEHTAGGIGPWGILYADDGHVCARIGVSPAFNINLSSVIFSSVISGTAGEDDTEYKLTLADSDMTIGIQSGKTLTASGNKITVPYTITGNDASKATQVSVLILDKPYTAGNTNSAKIKYYGKLDTGDGAGFMSTGTGTFTLPSGLSIADWRNSRFYVYLLAEDVNDIYETDYASMPLRVSGPDAPNIIVQPVSKNAVVGDIAKFSITAVGSGTLSYQWQCKAPSAASWSDSTQSGAKTATLSVSVNPNHHGYQYRCVVTATNGRKAISNAATLSVEPKITTQPASKAVEVGDVATFTVAVNGKATLKYQWQCKAPGSSTWTNSTQTGNKTAKLSVNTNVNHHGYQYRCVVKDGNGKTITSDAAMLFVKSKITTQPAGKTVEVGDTATFTVAANGKATLKYQWQCKSPGSDTWKDSTQTGNKTAKLSVTTNVNHQGYQYRCVVTDRNGQKNTSNAATLTVKPKITTQPANKSVTVGTTVTLTVAANGKATLKYQWQYKTPGSDTWKNSTQSGAKTSTLTIKTTKNHNGYQYRCVVTDGNNKSTESDAATLTVK